MAALQADCDSNVAACDDGSDSGLDKDLDDVETAAGSAKKDQTKKAKPPFKSPAKSSSCTNVSRSAQKSRKGKKYCRGCVTWLPMDQFAVNQSLHFACKQARDNLYRIAQRQKQLEWFQATEADDTKFNLLLINYNERCPMDPSSRKRARGKIVCLSLKTVIEAATELIKDDVGEMMHELEFIDWCKTPKGGMLDPVQAKRKWDDLVEDKRNQITDMRGPEKHPLRVRVCVKDLVIFRNRVSQARSLELMQQQSKNPDDLKISKAVNSALTGTGVDARSGALDLSSVAKDLAASGSGATQEDGFMSAFDSGFVADVKGLVDESDGESSDGEDERKVKADAKPSDAPVSTPSKSSKGGGGGGRKEDEAWLDENVVHRAQRQWRDTVTKVRIDFESTRADSDDILNKVRGGNLADNPHFKNSLGLLQRRNEVALKVLGTGDVELQEYLKGTQTLPAGAAGAAASPAKAAARDMLRQAAPCRNHMDLRTFDQMLKMAEEFEKALTLEEVKATTARLSAFRTAARSLHAAWKSAVVELSTAYTGYKKALEASEKDAAAKRKAEAHGAGKSKVRKVVSALEIIQEKGTQIPTVSREALSQAAATRQVPEGAVIPEELISEDALTEAKPFVVTGVPVQFPDGSHIYRALGAFMEDFKASDIRSKAGRAMRTNEWEESTAAANDYVLNSLAPISPKGSIFAPALPSTARFLTLRQSMALASFGVRGGSRHSSIEKDQLWCGRLVVEGTRCVALVRSDAIQTYMKEKGILGVDVKAFFRDLREDGLTQLMASTTVWHATTGPGDYLWVPANTVVLESVMKDDCYGLRVGMLLEKDVAGHSLFKSIAGMAATPDGHVSKAVVDAIAAARPSTTAAGPKAAQPPAEEGKEAAAAAEEEAAQEEGKENADQVAGES